MSRQRHDPLSCFRRAHGNKQLVESDRCLGHAEVDAFHRLGLLAGGRDNGAPGFRRPGDDAALLLDPDGNNIEAVYRGGQPGPI